MSEGPAPAGSPPEEEEWARPPRREADPGAAPILSVDGWEGPLDWLLELARSRRIDLVRLPIAMLMEAFAQALDEAIARRGSESIPLGTLGDWVVMAATLTLLRSRLMLPKDDAGARQARAEAEALRLQLVDRAATAAASDWLERREQLGRDVFVRGRPEVAAARAGRVGDIAGLLRACLAAIELPWDVEAAYRLPPVQPWTVAQATERIRQLLPPAPGCRELGSFLPGVPAGGAGRELRCRAAVAATFCSALELAREEQVKLCQLQPWGAVILRAAARADGGNEPTGRQAG